MARKETITVGLPPPLMRALEVAQEKLYKQAVGAGAPPGVKYSRAVIIEMALVDFLRGNGIKVDFGKPKGIWNTVTGRTLKKGG